MCYQALACAISVATDTGFSCMRRTWSSSANIYVQGVPALLVILIPTFKIKTGTEVATFDEHFLLSFVHVTAIIELNLQLTFTSDTISTLLSTSSKSLAAFDLDRHGSYR
jgi:hypothetical protein